MYIKKVSKWKISVFKYLKSCPVEEEGIIPVCEDRKTISVVEERHYFQESEMICNIKRAEVVGLLR